MDTYCTRTLEGASPVELVIALYDGMIRFLYLATEAVDQGDVRGRRVAVKQAQLRMDVGGVTAQTLSEFYASVFAQILQASHFASRRKFEHAINCVRNVREAWRQVATDIKESTSSRSALAAFSVHAGNVKRQAVTSEVPRWTA
jgi:flagellar secretion chaperone FliS